MYKRAGVVGTVCTLAAAAAVFTPTLQGCSLAPSHGRAQIGEVVEEGSEAGEESKLRQAIKDLINTAARNAHDAVGEQRRQTELKTLQDGVNQRNNKIGEVLSNLLSERQESSEEITSLKKKVDYLSDAIKANSTAEHDYTDRSIARAVTPFAQLSERLDGYAAWSVSATARFNSLREVVLEYTVAVRTQNAQIIQLQQTFRDLTSVTRSATHTAEPPESHPTAPAQKDESQAKGKNNEYYSLLEQANNALRNGLSPSIYNKIMKEVSEGKSPADIRERYNLINDTRR